MIQPGKLAFELARFARRVLGLAADQFVLSPGGSLSGRGLALIHRGRCGSTVLGSLLHQNAAVYWDGEALLPHRQSERWLRRLQGARGISKTQDLKALMRFARTRRYVLSCKGQLGYDSVSELVRNLLDLGFDRAVVLERKNALRWLVSAEIATQRRAWHLKQGKPAKLNAVQIPLHYDQQQSLADRLHGLAQWHNEVRQCLAGQRVLNLTYERHIQSDPTQAYRAVCEFIGVPATLVRVTQTRQNPFPLTQLIANYREVESALEGTGLEWMFSD